MMIVLPYPSADEVKAARLFAGPAAIALGDALQKHGIHPSKCYFTSAVKCAQLSGHLIGPKEYTTCRSSFLVKEIREYDPDSIIAFGKKSFDEVVKPVSPGSSFVNGKIVVASSSTRDPAKGKVVIGVHFHPSFYLYAGKNLDELRNSLGSLLSRMQKARVGEMRK